MMKFILIAVYVEMYKTTVKMVNAGFLFFGMMQEFTLKCHQNTGCHFQCNQVMFCNIFALYMQSIYTYTHTGESGDITYSNVETQ